MITMTEIARLTGVSQPTVSRVLNGNTAVNPEIRERVLACAREHDFQPNVMAQSLVGSKTRLIGVIVTDISNSFFAELVKYIGEEARKDGYSLILFSSDYDLEKERECLDVVKRYRVDGLIMVPVDENGAEWRGMVSRLDIPTVVITRRATGIDSFYVAHDEAGAQVARHLHEQGYEEYIFFGNTTDDKYLGFIDGMANECREFRKHLTIISSKDSQVIEAALKKHFAKTTGKTGIFAYNDRRAVQMMGILQKMKIRVPEQVGIVGFDNIYLCEVLYPSLSSIAQPNETMASLAVQRLLYRMDYPNDQKREDHPLHAELICRQSSDLKGGILSK